MKNHQILIILCILIIAATFIFCTNQFVIVERAHGTFENYYAFRGCGQLLEKTDTYGICKTDSGQTIKMVLFRGRWYLDGDLPACWGNFCF
jgi:hypothetical protein